MHLFQKDKMIALICVRILSRRKIRFVKRVFFEIFKCARFASSIFINNMSFNHLQNIRSPGPHGSSLRTLNGSAIVNCPAPIPEPATAPLPGKQRPLPKHLQGILKGIRRTRTRPECACRTAGWDRPDGGWREREWFTSDRRGPGRFSSSPRSGVSERGRPATDQADVVFQHLGHQAVDASAHGGQQHQYLRAVVLIGGERALHRTRSARGCALMRLRSLAWSRSVWDIFFLLLYNFNYTLVGILYSRRNADRQRGRRKTESRTAST